MSNSTRLIRLRNNMDEKEIQALLISTPQNIAYFSHFSSMSPGEREAFVLVTQKGCYLMTDARYIIEANELKSPEITVCKIEHAKGMSAWVLEILERENVTKLGFESDNLTYFEHQIILSKVGRTIELIPTNQLGLLIRAVKDPEEIDNIRASCKIADQCLREVMPTVHLGDTEKEIAFRLEHWVRKNGDFLAFDTIVALNEHAASAHYNTQHGNGKLKKGDLLLIDFGVKHQDYNSDITRMFYGDKLSEQLSNSYRALRESQEAALCSLKTATTYQEVDAVCKKILNEATLPEFTHALGHGIGLDVHELPRVSLVSTDEILEGHVCTIEPGVYVEGEYGMRLEDTVYVGKNKTIELLTTFPKDLYRLS